LIRPYGPTLGATIALAVLAAGCGGTASRPAPRSFAKSSPRVRATMERIAHQLGQTQALQANRVRAPRMAKRHRRVGNMPSPERAEQPRVPGAGGKLVGTYHTVMRGGLWLGPPRGRAASGQATVRFYGQTEFCWQFSRVQGLTRPNGISFVKGAIHDARLASLWLPFPGYSKSGCVTGIQADALVPIERHPGLFFLAIADSVSTRAIGGQL
jgi:hypothetical protein